MKIKDEKSKRDWKKKIVGYGEKERDKVIENSGPEAEVL